LYGRLVSSATNEGCDEASRRYPSCQVGYTNVDLGGGGLVPRSVSFTQTYIVEDTLDGGDIHFSVGYVEMPSAPFGGLGPGLFLTVNRFDKDFERREVCRDFISMTELRRGGRLLHQVGIVAIEVERYAPWPAAIAGTWGD
jgi:hypothetical protein